MVPAWFIGHSHIAREANCTVDIKAYLYADEVVPDAEGRDDKGSHVTGGGAEDSFHTDLLPSYLSSRQQPITKALQAGGSVQALFGAGRKQDARQSTGS